MKISIHVIILSDWINWTILFNDKTVISVYDYITVLILALNTLLLTNWDLLFELNCNSAEVYVFIINYILNWIQLCNNINKAVIISHYIWLNCIVKYEADSCFLISSDLLTVTKISVNNWIKQTFQTLLVTITVYHIVINTWSMNKLCKKHIINQNIIIYRKNPSTVKQIDAVVSHYSNLWKDYGNVIDISEREWMNILLLNNWKKLYKADQFKIYSLKLKNQKIIDKTFDKLHKQDWIDWTS